VIAVVSCQHFADDERIYHKQIQSLLRHNYEVTYFTKDETKLDNHPSLTHNCFKKDIPTKSYILQVCDVLRSLPNLTHVHIHEPELLPVLKWVKQNIKTVKTHYDVHEHMPSLYRTFSKRMKPIKELAVFLRKRFERVHLPFVDHVILANPSFSTSPYDMSLCGQTVIENFPELKYVNTTLAIEQKPNSIIYHGHLGPERGIQDLVLCFSKVLNQFPDASCTLVGTFRTSQFEKEVTHLIQKLNLEENITIKFQIPHDEIWEELMKHEVGIIPFQQNPLTKNNVPTKLFEMMSAGLSIVATRVKPIQHYVSDSVFWANPNHPKSLSGAIIDSLKSSKSKSMIIENQMLIQSQYNWSQKENTFLSLFESI